ncbi:MAG: hypothetical protein AAF293_03440 [Pseudomonadota bacterium]
MGYRNIRDLEKGPCAAIRALLESYWDQCKGYADEMFREEFAVQPDPRFWELYLFHRLLSAGKALVERARRPNDGPDLLVDDGDQRVWIEAVTFGPGDDTNPDRVPDLKYDGTAQYVPLREIELRISSVFMKKSNTFIRYLENERVSRSDLCLIAINPGQLSPQTSFEDRGSPFCVLYPLGDQYVTFRKNSPETTSGYYFRTELEKSSRTKVPTGMFADGQHDHIAGVIWSNTTLGNFFYGENDLTLFPNSTPIRPLTQGWLDWAIEWGASVHEDNQCTLTRLT